MNYKTIRQLLPLLKTVDRVFDATELLFSNQETTDARGPARGGFNECEPPDGN
jgi:hypothetical protein